MKKRVKDGHVQRVNAAVCKLCRHACLRLVIPSANARIVCFGGAGLVTMGEFGEHDADAPQIITRHHRPHVTHKALTGIALVHGADAAGVAHACDDVLAFLFGHGHRLFAQEIEACVQGRLGNLLVVGVGRRDGHQIKVPVHKVALMRQHVLAAAESAVRRQSVVGGRSASL
ncbi:hypothetical protein [Loktanella sp. M215]|uniref:hypothetical protein n=1 Tax=Loktanella sp. M215 TaxID=2675431 RepID=UPI003FA5EABD